MTGSDGGQRQKRGHCAGAGAETSSEAGPAPLAAELYAAAAGADFIRTHDAAALCDGLKIVSALQAAALTY
jgi:dihydropteroate synthase